MEDKIKNILKERTISMFSDEWYVEASSAIAESIGGVGGFKNGYVYIIQSMLTRKVKIGRSFSPQKRINEIKSYVGDVVVISIIPINDNVNMESELHDRYKNFRVRGEWFLFDDLMDVYVHSRSLGGSVLNRKFNNSENLLSIPDTADADAMFLDIPIDVLRHFVYMEVFKEGVYDKKFIYESFNGRDRYSQRVFTSYFRKFITHRGMRFVETKSGSKRNIKVFF